MPQAAEETSAVHEASGKSEEKSGVYKFFVTDVEGRPVSGVTMQLCSDKECMLEKTNEDGNAEFAVSEGKYTAHILKVPEGFIKDDTVYDVPEKYGTVEIVLKNEEIAAESESTTNRD